MADSIQRLLEVLRRRPASLSLVVEDRKHIGDRLRDGRNLPGGLNRPAFLRHCSG